MGDDGWIEWKGGVRAPADWDGGKVKFRDGTIGHTSGDHSKGTYIHDSRN